jgi:putative Mg2+ transporter-C (MgtC) family protein
MTATLGWGEIAVRLLLTMLAGGLIGLNRGEHGRPAGLRTTMIVCLAASIAMILANLLLDTTGKHLDSFVNIDPMRLPLGILTGMGFIGAGAVLRQKDRVLGLTTAASLWFVTVIGLCLGSGHIVLGMVGAVLALLILEGLWYVDRSILQDRHALLTVTTDSNGLTQKEIKLALAAEEMWIANCAVTYSEKSAHRKFRMEVRWRGRLMDVNPPLVLETFSQQPGVIAVKWKP